MALSKNVEATGRRVKAYDNWRIDLKELPGDTFTPLTYIEYTSAGARDEFICNLHCLIFPYVIGEKENLSEERFVEVKAENSIQLGRYKDIGAKLRIPAYYAMADYHLSTFFVQDLNTDTLQFRQLTPPDFAATIIRQRWEYDPKRKTGQRIEGPIEGYSSWHRYALSNSSYLCDIDYVELRDSTPVAIIEATQSNGDNLRKATLGHADISTTSDIYVHLDNKIIGEGTEILAAEILGSCDLFVTQKSEMVS